MFNKKSKLSLVLVLMLVMATILTACGDSKAPDKGNTDSGDATDSGEEITIKFSHNQPVTSPEIGRAHV